MTTYNETVVNDAAIAHKKGITVAQGRALRDNLKAVCEDDPTAPHFEGRIKSSVLTEPADASTSGTTLAIASISSVAVAGNQKLRVWVNVRLRAVNGGAGTMSIDDVKIKHNGTTLSTRTITNLTPVGAGAETSSDVSILAQSTTVATGSLVVESACSTSGGGGTAYAYEAQVLYDIINT